MMLMQLFYDSCEIQIWISPICFLHKGCNPWGFKLIFLGPGVRKTVTKNYICKHVWAQNDLCHAAKRGPWLNKIQCEMWVIVSKTSTLHRYSRKMSFDMWYLRALKIARFTRRKKSESANAHVKLWKTNWRSIVQIYILESFMSSILRQLVRIYFFCIYKHFLNVIKKSGYFDENIYCVHKKKHPSKN